MTPEQHGLQDQDTFRVLEFDVVRKQLVELTLTPYGRELAACLIPDGDPLQIGQRQAATTAGAAVLRAGYEPVAAVPEIRPIISRVLKGAPASAPELAQVRDFLAGLHQLQRSLSRAGREMEHAVEPLVALAEPLARCQELFQRLDTALDEEGAVRDEASPRLASLRRRMVTLRQRVRQRLEGMTRSSVHAPHLQEQLVTRRQGRYVLPVKAGSRDKVPGIVHDRSGSGLTLFIEPLAVVNANNEIVELERQEEQEVARILAELSTVAAGQADDLSRNVEGIGALDLAVACGRLSTRWDAVEPKLNRQGRITVKAGRHPLLTVDPVPIDLQLGGDFHTLVITGPNTGGKTVTLKTVGLFTLMAQSGLHVPAAPGTELAIFEQVFADIGDEQSIEQSLSTFSGHMRRIVHFVRRAHDRTLVLLDEIGAGTDPQEGAALAMALLDHFHGVGARTVATTHFSQLKTYAYRRQGVENASVQFDVETLEPTYRLEMGLPGTSNAFAIASRLGLPSAIIQRASSFVDEDQAEMARLIQEMEADRRREEEARDEAARALAESQQLRRQARHELEAAKAQRQRIRDQAEGQARELLEDAASEAEAARAQLRQLRQRLEEAIAAAERARAEAGSQRQEQDAQLDENTADSESVMGDVQRRLKRRLDDLSRPEPEPDPPSVTPEELEEGTHVRIRSLGGRSGTVIRRPEGGEVEVQVGKLRITAHISDLEAVPASEWEDEARRRPGYRRWRVKASHDVDLSLMVRGMTVEEARARVDRYLDRAFLAGRERVVIIHGKGTGTLRRTTRAFLDEHPHVLDWYEAPPAEGGSGATVVELARRD